MGWRRRRAVSRRRPATFALLAERTLPRARAEVLGRDSRQPPRRRARKATRLVHDPRRVSLRRLSTPPHRVAKMGVHAAAHHRRPVANTASFLRQNLELGGLNLHASYYRPQAR